MKTLWMILIGMVLFNGFIFTFNSFFPYSPMSTEQGKLDLSNATNDFSSFKSPSGYGIATLMGDGAALGFLGIGMILTIVTKDLKYLAACGVIGLITEIWNQTARVFSSLMNQFQIIGGIYTLISIAIGICVALLILGIFTDQEQLG